jgi:deoxyribose-phosphate aldolase
MKISPRKLIPFLDLTCLNENDTPKDIVELCQKATTPLGHVAAICVYPQFVSKAHHLLAGKSISVATVVNFPSGNETLSFVATQITEAIANGADEIDAVMPYQTLKEGRIEAVKEFLSLCRQLCDNSILLKIILETSELNNHDLIASATELAIEGGADFIKTSTGKKPVGATPSAAREILNVIKNDKKRRIGFKVSGGVRTIEDAMTYVDLVSEVLGNSWLNPQTFRIGASQLLDNILQYQ